MPLSSPIQHLPRLTLSNLYLDSSALHGIYNTLPTVQPLGNLDAEPLCSRFQSYLTLSSPWNMTATSPDPITPSPTHI